MEQPIVAARSQRATAFADLALTYFEAGANVIPIKPGEKVTLVRWKRWQNNRQTESDVKRLIEAYPWADIAIVLGKGSGGLVDIETDGPRGERSLQTIGLPLPPTPTWESKRGWHRLYRFDKRLRSSKPRAGLEIRADGSYAIVPPSGNREWVTSFAPQEIQTLPKAWEDLARRTRNRSASTPLRQARPGDRDPLPPSYQVPQYSVVLGYGKGGRNTQRIVAPGSTAVSANPAAQLVPARTAIRTPTPGPILIPAPGILKGKGLEDLFRQTDVVDRILAVLGIAAGATSFKCIFPWHQDEHPSASIYWLPREGLPVYRDWHARAGEREFLKLPEVRAALAYGEARQLSGPEFATWALILLVEAAVLSPVPMTAPALPSSALPSVRKVYEGFLFLLACKWLHTPAAPTSFSRRFAAALTGVPEAEAGKAIHILVRSGVIRVVGKAGRACLYALASTQH